MITTRSAPRRQLRTAIRPPAYGIETPEMDSTFDRASWLAHCDGYPTGENVTHPLAPIPTA